MIKLHIIVLASAIAFAGTQLSAQTGTNEAINAPENILPLGEFIKQIPTSQVEQKCVSIAEIPLNGGIIIDNLAPNGKLLAALLIAGNQPKSLKIYELPTGKQLGEIGIVSGNGTRLLPSNYVWSPESSLYIQMKYEDSGYSEWLEWLPAQGKWSDRANGRIQALKSLAINNRPSNMVRVVRGDDSPPVWSINGTMFLSATEANQEGTKELWEPPTFHGITQTSFILRRNDALQRVIVEGPPTSRDSVGRTIANAYVIVDGQITSRFTYAWPFQPFPLVFAYEEQKLIAYNIHGPLQEPHVAWRIDLGGQILEHLYCFPERLRQEVGVALAVTRQDGICKLSLFRLENVARKESQ